MLKDHYEGRIEKVVTDQSKPYAIAYCDEAKIKGTVYIALDEGWRAEIQPEKGMIVVLDYVYMTQHGWRAKSSRPFTPEDKRISETITV